MPPKKKMRVQQTGIKALSRQYLESNFSLPDDVTESTSCKNGHVLLQYLEKDKKAKDAAKSISEKFGFMPTVGKVNYLFKQTSGMLYALFHEPTRKRFEDICNETFKTKSPAATAVHSECSATLISDDSVLVEPSQSESLNTDSQTACILTHRTDPLIPCLPDPGPSTSSCSPPHCSLRSHDTTPRKQLLKRRLSFVSKSHSKLQEKHRQRLAHLKANLKKQPNVIKHLNQKIKRKDAVIKILKQKLREVSKQNQSQMKKIPKEQNIRDKMRQIKTKVKSEFESKLKQKDASIKEKDRAIRDLEIHADELEERNKTGKLLSVKKDKKTYNPDMRMMVYDCIVNQVPGKNIPTLLQKLIERLGLGSKVKVPCRSLVNQMTRE